MVFANKIGAKTKKGFEIFRHFQPFPPSLSSMFFSSISYKLQEGGKMSVDSYEIVENPDKKYYELMLKEVRLTLTSCTHICFQIVRTDGWSRLSGEYDIWKESKEKFWFWIAFEKSKFCLHSF